MLWGLRQKSFLVSGAQAPLLEGLFQLFRPSEEKFPISSLLLRLTDYPPSLWGAGWALPMQIVADHRSSWGNYLPRKRPNLQTLQPSLFSSSCLQKLQYWEIFSIWYYFGYWCWPLCPWHHLHIFWILCWFFAGCRDGKRPYCWSSVQKFNPAGWCWEQNRQE